MFSAIFTKGNNFHDFLFASLEDKVLPKERLYALSRKGQKRGQFLMLKAPITNAADNIDKYFFIVCQKKIRLDVLSESSARQRIHMKNQALFSLKDKSKKLKCRLLQFLFGALRVTGKNLLLEERIIAYRVDPH